MQPYIIGNFANNFQQWINGRFLAPIPYIRWGWEEWIQVDFPVWLDVFYGVQFDFIREFQIQNNRVDWAINSTVQQGYQPIYVEIKVQTPLQPTNNFINRVQDDINRLNQLFPLGNGNKIVLAAAIDQSAIAPLVAEGFQFTAFFQDIVWFYTLFW